MAGPGKRRRARGEGSLTPLADGRWLGRYWVTLPDGTKKRQSVCLKDRTAVMEKMRAEMALADMGTPVLRDKRTTGEYLNYWIRYIAPNQIRPTTLQLHTYTTQKYLCPILGKIPLTQLKPEHVRIMLNRMKSMGCSARTQQRARNTLSAALREALKLELVTRNVARLVDPPEYVPPEKRTWTIEQVALFLRAAKDHPYYLIFLLLLCYGMRRGEVLGLRWEDIDFENGIIMIRRSLCLVNQELCLIPPKTKASIRDLPMLPVIKEALLTHYQTMRPHEDGLLFHTSNENPAHPHILRRSFKRLAIRADLPPITIHEARHTAATMLAESWASPKEAQVILGHASISTTLQIYTHTNMKQKTAALNAMAERLFPLGLPRSHEA